MLERHILLDQPPIQSRAIFDAVIYYVLHCERNVLDRTMFECKSGPSLHVEERFLCAAEHAVARDVRDRRGAPES